MRLIDADALLSDIERTIEESGCVNHEREIIECVEFSPTIEPPQGEWLCRDNRSTITAIGYIMEWYECSLCGATHTTYDGKYQHCPDCGAKMKGGE